MATRSDYLAYAGKAAQVLTANWFGPGGPSVWVNRYPDFWRAPNAMIALTRLMTLTEGRGWMPANVSGQQTFSYWFRPFAGYPLWYTDCAWWGNAFMYVHMLLKGWGTDGWTDMAANARGDVWGGWDDTLGGGIWTMRRPRAYPDNAKGALSTLLSMDLVGRFAFNSGGGTPPPSWYDQSFDSWNWLVNTGLYANGLLYDSLDAFGRPQGGFDLVKQAVAMGAMPSIFVKTPGAWAGKQASVIADATLNRFLGGDGVLRAGCELSGSCTPADNGTALHKGIFMRYLAETVAFLQSLSLPYASYSQVIRKNADVLWANYPGRVYGMSWSTYSPGYQPTGDFLWDACLQASAVDLFVSAAAVAPG